VKRGTGKIFVDDFSYRMKMNCGQNGSIPK
jgi:hypothetical protein